MSKNSHLEKSASEKSLSENLNGTGGMAQFGKLTVNPNPPPGEERRHTVTVLVCFVSLFV